MPKILIPFVSLFLIQAPAVAIDPLYQEPTEIPLRPGQDNGNIPRSDAQECVHCYFISNSIALYFLSDLGNVDVTINEATNGIVFSDIVNSGNGVAILDFSGSSGQYTITISISTGLFYYGEFVL